MNKIKAIGLVFGTAVIIGVTLFLIKANSVSLEEFPAGPSIEPLPSKIYTKVDSLFFKYDSLLSNEIDSIGSVGAALVVTYKGEIALLRCFGVKEVGGTDSIDAHTIFRLASVSKTITGTLAGILSSENIIRLDDKVINYLPDFQLKDSVNTDELSIRNILSHSSGLVPHAYDNLVEDKVPFSIIIDSLYRVNIGAPPGRLYGYQNVVFSLYDTISKLRTLKSFEENLIEKVFLPFGMNDASAGYKPVINSTNLALPHTGRNHQYRSLRINDRYYNTKPAAGINASITDMGHFLIALSGHDSSKLSPAVIDTILSPQIKTPLRWNYLRKWDRVDSKYYAIGWRIIGYKGRKVAYHGGYVKGYNAEIAFCPEEDIGIAFLTNSPNAVGSVCIPMFLNMYFEMQDANNQSYLDRK